MNARRIWTGKGKVALGAALACLVLTPVAASAQNRNRAMPPASGSQEDDERPQPRVPFCGKIPAIVAVERLDLVHGCGQLLAHGRPLPPLTAQYGADDLLPG